MPSAAATIVGVGTAADGEPGCWPRSSQLANAKTPDISRSMAQTASDTSCAYDAVPVSGIWPASDGGWATRPLGELSSTPWTFAEPSPADTTAGILHAASMRLTTAVADPIMATHRG